jgi:mono/diheme cytochrome c family protein
VWAERGPTAKAHAPTDFTLVAAALTCLRSRHLLAAARGSSPAHAEAARTRQCDLKKRHMPSTQMILRWITAVLAVATLAACQPAGPGGAMPALTPALPTAAGNGARIYFTAASDRSTAITYAGGPDIGGGMMGGGGRWLTCASCHGPEGRGGIHTMHMRLMTAPDIRYAALATMPELKRRSRPYDLEDFRKTIESGRHPDGEALGVDMPRWHMSEADLGDLFTFLKSLPN